MQACSLTLPACPPPPPRLASTRASVLQVASKKTLLEGLRGGAISTSHLDVKIGLRAPYLAPLNILQVGGCACVRFSWRCACVG